MFCFIFSWQLAKSVKTNKTNYFAPVISCKERNNFVALFLFKLSGLPILGNLLELAKKDNQKNAVALPHKYIKELGPIYKIKYFFIQFEEVVIK